MKTKHFVSCLGVAALGFSGVLLCAAPQTAAPAPPQAAPQAATSAAADAPATRDTISKPMTAKQKKKQEDKLRKELEGPYKKWLNEDVTYIITDEERKA